MADLTTPSTDPERLALSWCFHHADLKPLIDAGFTWDDFEDQTEGGHADLFEWALGHYHEHGASPGVDALRLHDPNWRLATPTDGIAVYIASIREGQRYNLAQSAVQRAGEQLAELDLVSAVQTITQTATDLATTTSAAFDEDITLDWEPRYEFYEELRTTPGQLRGRATGFHTIDRATNGVQPSQFIALVGPPKSGKSTALMAIAKYMNEHGASGLLVSFEMSAEEQKARWDAMWAHVAVRKIMEGRTTAADMNKLKKFMRKAHDGYPFTLSTDISRMATVSGLASKVEKHKPDVVFVDGIYMMQDENGEPPGSPQAMNNITQGLKKLTQTTTVPIIGTSQTSEAKTTRSRGVTTGSVSFSGSFLRDPDVLLGLQPADDDEGKVAELRTLLSRSGPLVRAQLEWNWDEMIFEELYGGDYDNSETPTQTAGGY